MAVNCELCKQPKESKDLFAYYQGRGVCRTCVDEKAGALIGAEMGALEKIIAKVLSGESEHSTVQQAVERFRNAGNPES